MGDNMGKIMHQTLPYNTTSLTTLWYHVDPKHNVVSRLLCICFSQHQNISSHSKFGQKHLQINTFLSKVCWSI